MALMFETGDLVKSDARPEWGVGQVQSCIDGRVTVNFENEGKVVLVGDEAGLRLVAGDWS
ncbi:MAG: DUF3553 domain-containing protein [Pseudomonadota bacterium]